MFCKNCGKQIKDDIAFCPYCGTQTGVPQGQNAQKPKNKNMDLKAADSAAEAVGALMGQVKKQAGEATAWVAENTKKVQENTQDYVAKNAPKLKAQIEQVAGTDVKKKVLFGALIGVAVLVIIIGVAATGTSTGTTSAPVMAVDADGQESLPEGVLEEQILYTLDDSGNIATEKSCYFLGESEITMLQEAGEKVKEGQRAVAQQTEYTYDSKGNILSKRIGYPVDMLDEESDISYSQKYAYEYDAAGNRIKETWYQIDRESGEESVMKESDVFYAKGDICIYQDADCMYDVNEKNQVVCETRSNGEYTVFEYNAEGLLQKEKFYALMNGGLYPFRSRTYSYDEHGNLTEKCYYEKASTAASDFGSFESDAEYEEWLNSEPVPSGRDRWEYTYDKQGHMTSKKEPNGMTTVYGYDKKGNLMQADIYRAQ